MKLSPEVLRFAFLMEEVLQKDGVPNGASHDRTPAELFRDLEEAVDEVEGCIDLGNQTVYPDISLRLFAEAAARVACYGMMLCDHVNQLPQCRHGLIEAMNAHCT